MFKKLLSRLILINLSVTTFVIVVVFATIYIVSTKAAENRPPRFETNMVDMGADANANANTNTDTNWEKVVQFSMKEERKSAAENLLITLVCSGVAIELVVAFVSYFLAKEAIKPVKEAYESQKIFIANASHEIKTPLAAISANLEAADIKNNTWIDNVEIETQKLSAINSQLLTLARSDISENICIEPTNLNDEVTKLIESFKPRMKNLNLRKKILITKKIEINREDFLQIFSILFDNAVKYAEKKLNLTLSEHELVIENDGATIPADKLPHIFDRFYQVDKSKDGVGLGLSIAKSLADKNHWKLEAKSNKKTTFILKF